MFVKSATQLKNKHAALRYNKQQQEIVAEDEAIIVAEDDSNVVNNANIQNNIISFTVEEIQAVQLPSGQGKAFTDAELLIFDEIMQLFKRSVKWDSFTLSFNFRAKKEKLLDPSCIVYSRSKKQLEERKKTANNANK